MRVLVKLNHPAHFHLFKILIKKLRENGDHVIIVIKNKDILKELLDLNNESYLAPVQPFNRKVGNKFSIIKANLLEIILQDFNLYKIVLKEKPDVMIGTDTSIAHLGSLLRIPSYVLNEDDYQVNKLFCSFTYPFATYIVSPKVCDVGNYKSKKIEYDGYQKLAYLHPEVFNPDLAIVKKYFAADHKYFLLRLVSFSAGHDIEKSHSGLNKGLLLELINILSEKGKVFITSEKKLIPEFEDSKLKINPNDIHHVLAFSELFISDSQSMTVEAAMLGVPSVRFNSFVGKISVLNEIECRYKLSVGIDNNRPEELINTIKSMIDNRNLKNEFQEKRDLMLTEKINLTEFMFKLLQQRM